MTVFRQGDKVIAAYTDALGKVLNLEGVVERFDEGRGEYLVAVRLGVALWFAPEKLKPDGNP